jgi:hypothetical protein
MLILHITKTFRIRSTEWFLAWVVFSWGWILLLPVNTFAVSASYTELARWGSEDTWGWFCLIGGGIRLSALVINGAARPSPHVRMVFALLSAFFFWNLTLGFLASGAVATGFAVYPAACLFDIYNALQAAQDAAESDRKAREKNDAGASS